MTATPCFDWDYCDECGGAGELPDIGFWCATCRSEGTVHVNSSHYEVRSPAFGFRGWDEPPDEGYCWVVVLAGTKRDAASAALKSPEFVDWLSEARSNATTPFNGLEVSLFRCEHGVCWECGDEDYDPEQTEYPCAKCKVDDKAEDLAEGIL